MTIKIEYTSKYFTEQYNVQLAAARDLPIKNVRTNDHEVTDTIRKIVTKKQKKQYKFESALPFNIEKRIEFLNNSYFI